MKKSSLTIAIASVVALGISGCASSGVIELDKGTYYISKPDSTPGLGPPSASLISEVYTEANTFCAKRGKVMKTTNKTILDAAPARMGSIKLEFQCI